MEGAKSYLFQCTTEPIGNESIWISDASTKSEYTLKGLLSGKKYWCRVVAIGSNDQQTFSNPVARYVQ